MHIAKVSTDHRTTKDNPAFVAFVMLRMAEISERKGMLDAVTFLRLAAGKLTEEHGQFPDGVLITVEAQEAVMEAVVATFAAEAKRALAAYGIGVLAN